MFQYTVSGICSGSVEDEDKGWAEIDSIWILLIKRTGSSDSDCGSTSSNELGSRVNVSAGGGSLEGSDLGQESHGFCVLGNQGLALGHHSTAQWPQVRLGSVQDLPKEVNR